MPKTARQSWKTSLLNPEMMWSDVSAVVSNVSKWQISDKRPFEVLGPSSRLRRYSEVVSLWNRRLSYVSYYFSSLVVFEMVWGASHDYEKCPTSHLVPSATSISNHLAFLDDGWGSRALGFWEDKKRTKNLRHWPVESVRADIADKSAISAKRSRVMTERSPSSLTH